MIFPTYVFLLVFLPIVLCIWLSSLPLRIRLVSLTFASYIFYGWWDYRFTALLAASTIIDYICGKQIALTTDSRHRKMFLVISISANLAFLGVFKYFDFFAESLQEVFTVLGLDAHIGLLGLILPLGISFYTFQSMSYTIDIFRGHAKPAPDFLHFSAYVSMFPQLVAGPIVRYEVMAEQLQKLQSHKVTQVEISHGVWLFIIGMSKKLLIADNVALLADPVFNGQGAVGFGAAWIGSLAYTVQLYFDFSGYSDMAIGLGLMLGFRFPVNFNSPYKSRDISDFWNRWHISLSHFLRDYLFIPLGGSRGGLLKVVRNLFITMFLGGLWHGAQWTYVVWGLYHGLLLSGHALLRQLFQRQLPHVLAVICTFSAVHLGWVLFRAPTFERAGQILAGLFRFREAGALFKITGVSIIGPVPELVVQSGGLRMLFWLLLGLGIAFFLPNSLQIKRSLRPPQALILAIFLIACIAELGRDTPFIYFQF